MLLSEGEVVLLAITNMQVFQYEGRVMQPSESYLILHHIGKWHDKAYVGLGRAGTILLARSGEPLAHYAYVGPLLTNF